MLGYCRLFLNHRCLSVFIFSIMFGFIIGGIANAEQYRISGFVIDENGFGISGVKIQGLPSIPITDETGFYDEAVSKGWSGTITPIKEGFVFSPGQRDLQDIGGHQSLINFQRANIADVDLSRGLNLLSVPAGISTITGLKDWLLQVDSLAGVESALLYDSLSQRYVNVFPANYLTTDEQVRAGKGIMLYCGQDATMAVTLSPLEHKALTSGFNFRCAADLASNVDSAFDLLTLFDGNMYSLQRFNPETGKFETAAMDTLNHPVGVNFLTRAAEGVFINMAKDKPPLIQFEARPASILAGESAILYWTAHFADQVDIDNGIGSVDVSGRHVVVPSETTCYTLIASNALATSTQQTTIHVVAPPIPPSNLTAIPLSEGRAMLHWQGSTSADIHSYNIYCDHGTGTVNYQAPLDTVDFMTFQYTTETLGDGPFIFGVRAINQFGIEEKNRDVIISVMLDNTPPEPVNGLTAEVQSNGRVMLSWNGSISDDVSTYSVYYDRGSGDIDYTNPMITLPASMILLI
ncbi:MAG: fibronectin type III domain-containing protein [Desulfobacterales bacterium]|nr:fibronectin type III domain-containing protein [Desulfobacterales bacterium]